MYQSDSEYFAAHPTKLEYMRAPQQGEFGEIEVPSEAFVRVYLINRRSRVKALELPGGKRLATVIEGDAAPAPARRAA